MKQNKQKKALVIQGGGFRTGFSAGVLDAFLSKKYNPFDSYYVVSGGSIAVSYYLGDQYGSCLKALCSLAEDENFMSYNRLISQKGIMDVDMFHYVAKKRVPFDLDKALDIIKDRELSIVMTNRQTGKACYFKPNKENWIDAIIASCTLPFVTKGKHIIGDEDFMDGGWSDSLPVHRAIKDGATQITVIRTSPPNLKLSQSWVDYFGTFYYRSNQHLKACFETNHAKYNAAIDLINDPPKGVQILQVAPIQPLNAGTYSNSEKLIYLDYRHGLQCGLDFLYNLPGCSD